MPRQCPLRTAGPAGFWDVPPPAPSARLIGRAVTYEKESLAVRMRSDARQRQGGAPRPRLVVGLHKSVPRVFLAVRSEEAKSFSAMAVALAAVTLPSVVQELLSEMAAAVRKSARSTGQREGCVAALWAVDLAPSGREERFSWPSERWIRESAPALLAPVFPSCFPHVVPSPTPLVRKTKRGKLVNLFRKQCSCPCGPSVGRADQWGTRDRSVLIAAKKHVRRAPGPGRWKEQETTGAYRKIHF